MAVTKLRKPISLETTFGTFVVDELLGEGGAGRVYGGKAPNGSQIAIKILSAERLSDDKRQRFKNEIAFLARTKHPNIVAVTDHGVTHSAGISQPFYVMKRYDGSLRNWMRAGVAAQDVLPVFQKILDGVEAAHFQGAVHRDLKPENVLFEQGSKTPAVGDFGIASFTDDLVATMVETGPNQRLANFTYAAPEQRVPNRQVGAQADIYALGLMLNELFTAQVPHGTEYQSIGKTNPEFGFLDEVVARMLRQEPGERLDSIQSVKAAIASHRESFLSLQKISKLDKTVVPIGTIDEPLALEPPRLIGGDWKDGVLTLQMDRPVNREWIEVLKSGMGGHSYSMNAPPAAFNFDGAIARVPSGSHDAQSIINHFKNWLPQTTLMYRHRLEQAERGREERMREQLKRERAAEEQRLRVNNSLKF